MKTPQHTPSKYMLRKFAVELHRGSGRAYLILKNHPELEVDELLLEAARHNFDFDPALGGSRAAYIDELIHLRPTWQSLILKLAWQFAAEKDPDDWDMAQQYELLARNADVSGCIRKIIYHRCRQNPHEIELNYPAFIRMDGLGGLLFVARCQGNLMLQGHPCPPDPWIITEYLESCPDADWAGQLEEAAPGEAAVELWIERMISADQSPDFGLRRKIYRLEDVLAALRREVLPEGAENYRLTMEDYDLLGQGFADETSPQVLRNYCRLFKSTCTPRKAIPKLLQLAGKKSALGDLAIAALEKLHRKEIRELAMRHIEGKDGWRFTGLLARNLHKSDGKVLRKLIHHTRGKIQFHALTCDIISIAAQAHDKLDKRIPAEVFHRSRCSCCKEQIIRLLHEKNRIPEDLLPVMKHDASAFIRRTANAYLDH